MDLTPSLMKNSKQTLVFNFNNAVINEHVYDDDDDTSEVIIGKNAEQKFMSQSGFSQN